VSRPREEAMKDEHIIRILEGAPLGSLSEGELAAVRAHAEVCDGCARAFAAARVSSLLLKERVTQDAVPTPFFQTRVLAALRERRAADEAPAWRRMWRSAGAMVSSMAAVVILLTGLTFFSPEGPSEVAATGTDAYSDEALLLERAEVSDGEADLDQVFSTIYMDEGEGGLDGQDR
jgi:hypothetical protein